MSEISKQIRGRQWFAREHLEDDTYQYVPNTAPHIAADEIDRLEGYITEDNKTHAVQLNMLHSENDDLRRTVDAYEKALKQIVKTEYKWDADYEPMTHSYRILTNKMRTIAESALKEESE